MTLHERHEDYMMRMSRAEDALAGRRHDVYPCREDVPDHLWGTFIEKPVPGVNLEYTNMRLTHEIVELQKIVKQLQIDIAYMQKDQGNG